MKVIILNDIHKFATNIKLTRENMNSKNLILFD